MCTIILINDVHDQYPLIIAANRDESYSRESKPPEYIEVLPKATLAPIDVKEGGTWIGVSQGAWFVGITNQDARDKRSIANKRSRGHIVRDILLLGDHRAAARYLASLSVHDYDQFNLVFGRPGAMFLCKVHHDRRLELETIEQGITVITNDCINDTHVKRKSIAQAGANSILHDDAGDVLIEKLKTILSYHDRDSNQSLCVHDDLTAHGTRSSSIMLMSQFGDVHYFHNEGHACDAVTGKSAYTHMCLNAIGNK